MAIIIPIIRSIIILILFFLFLLLYYFFKYHQFNKNLVFSRLRNGPQKITNITNKMHEICDTLEKASSVNKTRLP